MGWLFFKDVCNRPSFDHSVMKKTLDKTFPTPCNTKSMGIAGGGGGGGDQVVKGFLFENKFI